MPMVSDDGGAEKLKLGPAPTVGYIVTGGFFANMVAPIHSSAMWLFSSSQEKAEPVLQLLNPSWPWDSL